MKVFCCLLLLLNGVQCWWIFSSTETEQPSVTAVKETARPVAFEIDTAEHKFLAEAQQFLDIPQLDQCQHKVISTLRGSCGSLHEEELGKLAVALLNCQSTAEDRPTFPCTTTMTLAECTGSMDASTWNAYHIVSNRARSVCYATRQEHFKRQTEMAVNHLSASTLKQLSAVQDLTLSHQEIKQLTQDSLQNVQREQNVLAEKQEELANKQDTVRNKITDNLQQLARERTLIHSGQKQLVNMTDSIKQQLNEASSLLSKQEKSRRQGQSEILEDVTRVRENIQQVWSKVDSSTGQLLGLMAEISNKYQSTLENLDRINSSVNAMLSLVVAMETTLSSQLDWLVVQLGGAQQGLSLLVLLATHAVFLLLATLCVLFVKAPALSRVTLLLLVCSNVLLELRYNISLTFSALTALQALVVLGNWLYLWLTHGSKRFVSSQLINQPIRAQLMDQPIRAQLMDQPIRADLPTSTSSWEPEEDAYNRSCTPVPNEGRSIEILCHTPSKLTPTNETLKCTARTKAGSKCRLPATPGEVKCRRHL